MSAAEAPDWFRLPAREFRPAAFWFWHHIPDEAEIAARLAEIATSRLGTILIQARLALPLSDYLSPTYLAACRLASAEAERLGVAVEIYDEYNWMSGHGGGRTVEGADHLRERHLFWTAAPIAGGRAELAITGIHSPFLEFLGPEGLAWCYEGGVARFDEWVIVAAIASGTGGDIRDVTDRCRIVAADDAGCRFSIDGMTEGACVTVFAAARCRTSRLVNYLLPEAAERFAERVYAPLLDAAGGRATSSFYDHPYAGFYRWAEHHGDVGNSLLWDARLPEALGTEPLGLQLLSLVADVGPATAGLRARFFATYGGRLHEAFFGTLRRWCEARGIGFSGHELLTHVGAWGLFDGLGGIDPRSMPGVDYFGVDAFRTATTVDAADYQPQLSAKFGDSVARSNGRRRCTIEQYSTGRETGMPGGAGQWGLTLARLRAQSIRHTLFGARRVLLHALYLDDGFPPGTQPGANPRFDFPPGFNFQPWWQDAPEVFDELARLSAFLEEGEPVRPVALFYPLATIRAEAMNPDCGQHFGWWAKALSESGIGFDVVDESSLAAAGVEDGRLVLASGRYDTLILPAVTTLATQASAALLARFAEAGGRLVLSGPLPWKSGMAGEDATLAATMRSAIDPAQHCPADEESVRNAVHALPPPVFRFDDAEPQWNSVLRLGDTMRLAVFNDGDHTRAASLDLPAGAWALSRWNPLTGERLPLAERRGPGPLRLEIGAHTVLCLEASPLSRPVAASPPAEWHTPLPEPVILAEGWHFHVPGGKERPIATDIGWERQGFAGFAGTGCYVRRIALPVLPSGLGWDLVLPGFCDTATCSVDGVEVGRSIAGAARFPLGQGGTSVALTLAIRNTAANRYYPGTVYAEGGAQPSGLTAPPRLEARAPGPSDLQVLPEDAA